MTIKKAISIFSENYSNRALMVVDRILENVEMSNKQKISAAAMAKVLMDIFYEEEGKIIRAVGEIDDKGAL